MTSLQDNFEVNSQDVAAKVISGETILINLTSGIYFSMDGAGTTIWQLLEGGHSLEQVARAVSATYGVASERVRSDVLRLAAELVDAGLIVPTDRPAPPRGTPQAADEHGDRSDLRTLAPPMPGIINTPWTDPSRVDGPDGPRPHG